MSELESGQEPKNVDEIVPLGEVDSKTSKDSTIEDLPTALKEIEKLRKENAAKRVKNKDTETELEEFRQWKESQKTEVERLLEAKESAERELKTLRAESLRNQIAAEVNLDPDLYEFVTGADAEEMRAKATKLASKAKTREANSPESLHAGNRGTYIAGSNKKSAGGLFLEHLADNA